MAKKSMKQIAGIMKKLDVCMFVTLSGRGAPESRPMSNNGDVDYKGKSWFFAWDDSHMAREIKKNSSVSLAFSSSGLFRHRYISVQGKAKLIKNREQMADHWNKDLEIWFDKGIDTPGIVMIEVQARKINYWDGADQGEIKVS